MVSLNVNDVQLHVPGKKSLSEDIELFLRQESQKRVIDSRQAVPLFECLARARNVRTASIDRYKKASNIRNSVCELLEKHSKQFQSVIFLLVENFPSQEPSSYPPEEEIKAFYEKVISDCKKEKNLLEYTKLLLYAASTCINTPIYVVIKNAGSETNEKKPYRWSYFQPLFTYEGQPKNVLKYVTMAMTSEGTFYNVESRDISDPKPIATGLIGMYIEALEGISPLDIDVPGELLSLSKSQKLKLCRSISRDIVLRSCILFLKRSIIQSDEFEDMTALSARIDEFVNLVIRSTDAFEIVCQILINQRDEKVLSKFVHDWNNFVKSCDYLQKLDSLAALDDAIYQRNVSVSTFVDICQVGGRELDERRKAVTTTVIASSSVGILSGAMVITGLVLAPFSFGASLGLSIAGGVIGIGTGVTAGTARTVEAVKQNSKMKDIKEKQAIIEEKERNVLNALEISEELFKHYFRQSQDEEDIGISRRGFLAVGSALRASKSIANIILVAARLSTTAASVSAAVLGPLSLVVDIAFLTEAAYNKAKGDKTNAGEILQTIAETIGTKSKIFNSSLRGNWEETDRMHIPQQSS